MVNLGLCHDFGKFVLVTDVEVLLFEVLPAKNITKICKFTNIHTKYFLRTPRGKIIPTVKNDNTVTH